MIANDYLAGDRLFGDDFDDIHIAEWYEDEREGYAQLGHARPSAELYDYAALNIMHGYRWLPPERDFRNVLGFGSAFGFELLPLVHQISRLTIIDPSDHFAAHDNALGVPASFLKPTTSGDIQFPDGTFDLITCLGVLHHIPNVSHVLSELTRCLAPGSYLLLREPIVSMGDWTKERKPGITKRERGIPITVFRNILSGLPVHVVRETFCVFPPVPKLLSLCGVSAFRLLLPTKLDAIFCAALRWNTKYHRTGFFDRLGPSSVFYVLKRQEAPVPRTAVAQRTPEL